MRTDGTDRSWTARAAAPIPAGSPARSAAVAATLVVAAMMAAPARAAPDAAGPSVLRPSLAAASASPLVVVPDLAPDPAARPRPRLTPLQYAARRARSARQRAERAIRRRESEIRAWRRAAAEAAR